MSVDWAENVKKYVPNADEGAIAGIVRHCGIALRSRDASLVAFTDPTETDLVRESFLKRKLALTQPDSELDAAIAAVGARMKGENFRNRVTVYYLLAEHFDKLPLFHKKGAVAAEAAGVEEDAAPDTAHADTGKAGIGAAAAAVGGAALGAAALAGSAAGSAVSGVAGAAGAAAVGVGHAASATGAAVTGAAGAVLAGGAGVVGAAGAAAAGVAGAASGAAGAAAGAAGAGAAKLASVADHVHAPARGKGAWLIWALLLLAVLALLLWMFGCQHKPGEAVADATATATPTAAAAAPAATASAAADATVIPAGAGVTSGMRDGKPLVTVYFASGKADVVPAFAGSAGGLKAYLAAHAGSTLAVSGFADKTGNAAINAALSKKRAEAVKTALVADGVADSAILLAKPADDVDAAAQNSAARRVEVVAK